MATNIKAKKRINRADGTPYKEVWAAKNEPRYRQNGFDVNGDKIPFALAFDSVNNEYLDIAENSAITHTKDIDFSISFMSVNWGGGNEFILEKGLSSNPLNTRYYVRAFNSGGVQRYNFNINDNLGSLNQNIVLGALLPNVMHTVTAKDGVITVDGTSTYTINDSIININNLSPLVLCNQAGGANYFNGIISAFNYQVENFPLTYGCGSKIIGANGTEGTINTAAADPKKRVNYGMWLKGDDANGWDPYTQI